MVFVALDNTRGYRNCNPLNIRDTSHSNWLGRIPSNRSTDKHFVQFVNMEYGVRAAAKILSRYIVYYKLCTVYSIIHRWAPASDGNDVDSYVSFVTDKMIAFNCNPFYVRSNRYTLSALICAMSEIESNVIFSLDDVSKVLSKFKIG